jgi:hypothetical protein
MADAEVADDIASVYTPYLPVFSMLAAPSPDVCVVREIGAELGRRSSQQWPPQGETSPYMTMWLLRSPQDS